MPHNIILKKSSTAGKIPLASDLKIGEPAVNLADAKIYTKDASNNVIELAPGSGNLKSDGTVDMDTGYSPVNDLSLATKKFTEETFIPLLDKDNPNFKMHVSTIGTSAQIQVVDDENHRLVASMEWLKSSQDFVLSLFDKASGAAKAFFEIKHDGHAYIGGKQIATVEDIPSSASLFQFDYKIKVSASDATPPKKFISFDDVDFAQTKFVYINKKDRTSSDMTLFLSTIKKGDYFNIHDNNNINDFVSFDVTGSAVANGDVFEIPVDFYEKNGVIVNNERVFVHWQASKAGESIHHESGTTLVPNMRASNLFIYDLTADGVLEKPTSKMGDKGTMVFRQDSAGGHKITLDPAYTLGKNVLGLQGHMLTSINILEITESPAGVSLVDYIVYDTDKIFLNFIGEV